MGNIVNMPKDSSGFNSGGRWAPLSNVVLAAKALERAIHRSPNLPGIVSLYGPSGWGKSMAASYCANRFEGVYVECRSYFTKKAFVLAILKEMGIRAARTLPEMMEQVAEQLDLSQRPLIIDEMDHIVEKNAIEIVRDLHEMSRATMMLVGEEQFPRKLQRWERFHNRVLIWQPAQAATVEDVRKLCGFYVPGVDVAEDLLERVREISRGAARRICVNLDHIREHCGKHGLKQIDLGAWGRRDLYTGDAPARRLA